MYKQIGYGITLWFKSRAEVHDSIWYQSGYGRKLEFIPDGL